MDDDVVFEVAPGLEGLATDFAGKLLFQFREAQFFAMVSLLVISQKVKGEEGLGAVLTMYGPLRIQVGFPNVFHVRGMVGQNCLIPSCMLTNALFFGKQSLSCQQGNSILG